jgi:cardiolipin synthase
VFTDDKTRFFSPANICTALRLVLLPPLMWLLAQERFLLSLFLIALIGLSDLLDGWLARRMSTVSPFGAIFDVCADCVVIFALQGYLIAEGCWRPYLLAFSLMSVGSFGICATVRGKLSKNSLGQYTGAVLLIAFLLLALSRAVQPGLWEKILRVAGPLIALYLGLSILENLQAAYRRWEKV